MWSWERGKGKLTLLDNMNLLPVSIESIGASIGLPKMKVDFDTPCTDDLIVYCRRDVEIMVRQWQRWLDFLDTEDLGNFAVTIAGQAFNAYRHKYMPCKIGIHNNALAVDLERRAYRGARCEPFRVGKLPPGTYYKLDVNGLYAAMMQFYKYPRRLVKVVYNVRLDYLDHLLRDYLVIAECALHADEPKYPVQVNGRNAFPVGDFFTVLSTPEIQEAIIAGELVGVGAVALYEPVDLFSSFVTWATNLRQEYKQAGDNARSHMVKLLRNSLQGKFGQLGHHQEIIAETDIDDIGVRHWVDGETGRACVDWTFGGRTIRQYSEGEAFDSFPAIPAHVAAYGRLYMWSLMQMAGRENVYYTDTDSLLVNEVGFKRLAGMIDSYKLGYLKVEGVAQDVEVYTRKDYRFGDRQVTKGIKPDAVALQDGLYQQWHFTSIRYAFMQKNLDGVTLLQVEKRLSRNVIAGAVQRDGWITPPQLGLNPEDVRKIAGMGCKRHVWNWEFSQPWLDWLERHDSARWRLGRFLWWKSRPRPSSLFRVPPSEPPLPF